jgi:hypothetical protein
MSPRKLDLEMRARCNSNRLSDFGKPLMAEVLNNQVPRASMVYKLERLGERFLTIVTSWWVSAAAT